MVALPAAPPIDVERFYALTEHWRERAELVGGEVVVVPAPSAYHQEVLARVSDALRGWVREADRGHVLFAPVDVRLSDTTLVQPDVAWWAAGLDLRAQPSPPPDLAVEVLSPTSRRRDVTDKRRLYAAAAVAELWLVDPDERAVTALREPDGGDYAAIVAFPAASTVTSPLMPGFALVAGSLFPA